MKEAREGLSGEQVFTVRARYIAGRIWGSLIAVAIAGGAVVSLRSPDRIPEATLLMSIAAIWLIVAWLTMPTRISLGQRVVRVVYAFGVFEVSLQRSSCCVRHFGGPKWFLPPSARREFAIVGATRSFWFRALGGIRVDPFAYKETSELLSAMESLPKGPSAGA